MVLTPIKHVFHRIKGNLYWAMLHVVYFFDKEAREAAEDAADEAAAQEALKEELADPDNSFHYCPDLWNP